MIFTLLCVQYFFIIQNYTIHLLHYLFFSLLLNHRIWFDKQVIFNNDNKNKTKVYNKRVEKIRFATHIFQSGFLTKMTNFKQAHRHRSVRLIGDLCTIFFTNSFTFLVLIFLQQPQIVWYVNYYSKNYLRCLTFRK